MRGAARKDRKLRFTALFHHVTLDRLRSSYYALGRKEKEFLGFSYGFRPGRSQHDALDTLAAGILRKKVNWVLDCDIRGFFDAINHEWMQRFVAHRIGDRRLLGLIRKWLTAGIVKDGTKTASQVGSPQGATISPILANVVLHYVFDLWVQAWRRKSATGDMIIVRYADELIAGFQKKSDAERFRAELQQRLAKFDLELHPEKTRLIQFGRLVADFRAKDGKGRCETFDFLAFTHISGRSKNGKLLLLRHTMTRRMRTTLQAIRLRLLARRHLSIPEQGRRLTNVVGGTYAYHAVPTNIGKMESFCNEVIRSWRHALMRRSRRHRMKWTRMGPLADRWVPTARVQHPWCEQRFDATTRDRSPVR